MIAPRLYLKTKRGSSLVAVLLIISIMLVLGLGIMSRKALQSRRLGTGLASTQALLLAQAGLEDAFTKSRKAYAFPPTGSSDQSQFFYSENLLNRSGTEEIGRYSVTIDVSRVFFNQGISIITSVGTVGPEDSPVARHTVRAYLRRGSPNQLLDYRDLGAY